MVEFTYPCVGSVDRGPLYVLLEVLVLLRVDDVFGEELLERLVGEVDAELLERVLLERLEAEHVEDANERVLEGRLAIELLVFLVVLLNL